MVKKKKKIATKVTHASIQAKYPGSGIAAECVPEEEELFWVPSSSPVVNYQLGGGGAYGRIIELAGKESSGKTLLALDLIKSAQEMGGIGVFVDAELAFSKPWAILNGLDMKKFHIYEENIIEWVADFVAEISILYRTELLNNEPIVLVVDSVAALDSKDAMETSALDAKAEMGNRAKAFYRLLRVRNRLWHRLGVTVIFVNQLRDKINTGFGSQFEEKVTTVGGKALRFYASQRVYLEAKTQDTVGAKKNKRRVGIGVMFTMKKNKLGMPKIPLRIPVIFDPEEGDLGFSKYEGLAEIVIKTGAIEKSGNSYSLIGEVIANSLPELQELLEDDETLREEILEEAGIMTIEQMMVRLDEEVENLYPISGVTFTSFSDEKEEDGDGDE